MMLKTLKAIHACLVVVGLIACTSTTSPNKANPFIGYWFQEKYSDHQLGMGLCGNYQTIEFFDDGTFVLINDYSGIYDLFGFRDTAFDPNLDGTYKILDDKQIELFFKIDGQVEIWNYKFAGDELTMSFDPEDFEGGYIPCYFTRSDELPNLTRVPPPTFTAPALSVGPTPASLSEWKMIEGAGIKIWLPNNFEGGNLRDDKETVFEKLRFWHTDEGLIRFLDQYASITYLWAFDTQTANADYLVTLSVTQERVSPDTTLREYVDTAVQSLPSAIRLLNSDVMQLTRQEVGYLVFEAEQNQSLFCLIKDNQVIWRLQYYTKQNDFEKYLPIFEYSLETVEFR
jgi:hypothetical protein